MCVLEIWSLAQIQSDYSIMTGFVCSQLVHQVWTNKKTGECEEFPWIAHPSQLKMNLFIWANQPIRPPPLFTVRNSTEDLFVSCTGVNSSQHLRTSVIKVVIKKLLVVRQTLYFLLDVKWWHLQVPAASRHLRTAEFTDMEPLQEFTVMWPVEQEPSDTQTGGLTNSRCMTPLMGGF